MKARSGRVHHDVLGASPRNFPLAVNHDLTNGYKLHRRRVEPLRRSAIARLALGPGETG